eukprot:8739050-Pyramimonas_sp.AAC.1
MRSSASWTSASEPSTALGQTPRRGGLSSASSTLDGRRPRRRLRDEVMVSRPRNIHIGDGALDIRDQAE